MYQSVYGADNGGVYVLFSSMKSLAEVDSGMSDDKKFAEPMGADGMKKLLNCRRHAWKTFRRICSPSTPR